MTNPVGRPNGWRNPNSKTDRIIQLRASGMLWRDIAKAVGSSENSCKVLLTRRRHSVRFSASDPAMQPLPLWTRGVPREPAP